MSEKDLTARTIDYIENNLCQKITLDKLAEEFHYNKFHLNRRFLKKTGCTIYKYITARRLTEAARALAETEKTILEIAHEAQYSSQQAFTLAFHQLFLQSPQAYRKQAVFVPAQPRIDLRITSLQFTDLQNKTGRCMAA